MKTTIYSIIFILSMIFAVGSIDGGYKGVPMNDNWIGFVIFTVVGITFGVMAIKSMEGDDNGN